MADRTYRERITRQEAVKILCGIVDATRGAVQLRMVRAIRAGRLHRIARKPDRFNIGDLGTWAARSWPERRREIANAFPPLISAHSHLQLPAISVSGVGVVLPATRERCHAMIAAYAERIGALEIELADARAEAARERADAQRWRDFRKKSGRRGDW